MPARGPSATPDTTAITVTGCTLGMAANSTRPAAAAAARVAISTSSLLEPGPLSSQAAPATIIAPATTRRASAASSGLTTTQAAAPRAVPTARNLGKDGLPRGGRDAPVGDLAGEDE